MVKENNTFWHTILITVCPNLGQTLSNIEKTCHCRALTLKLRAYIIY